MINSILKNILVNPQKKIVLFGTGGFSDLFDLPGFNIEYYVDNNSIKWGCEFKGTTIKPPASLLEECKEQFIIIIASIYYDEIAYQLRGYGFEENIHFFNGDEALQILRSDIYGKVAEFKDKHKGKRAFIIGNGPSLTIKDLELLKDEVTFASNQIYLAFEKTEWRPTYYTVVDSLVSKTRKEQIRQLEMTKFFVHFNYSTLGDMPNAYWLYRERNVFDQEGLIYRFSDDVAAGVYDGASVTYTNLQLAYYMGFKEIYFLGVDFYYPGLIKKAEKTEKIFSLEPRYFTSNQSLKGINFIDGYHSDGEIAHVPDLERQYQAFQVAAQFLQQHGISVYNASRFSELDIFPKINFDEVINRSFQ